MKSAFNNGSPVIFTDQNGLPVSIAREDIESLGPGTGEQEGRTRLAFRKSERHPEGGHIHVIGSVEDAVALLNGDPSHAMIKEWQRDIVLQRIGGQQQAALQKLEYEQAREEEAWEKHLESLRQKHERAREDLGRNPLSGIALGLGFWARQHEPHSVLSRTASGLASIIGGKEYAAYVQLAADERQSSQKPPRNIMNVESFDERRARIEKEYAREVSRLQDLSKEPDMRPEDRRALDKKIEEYRAGQDVPDFRFVRTGQNSQEYRNSRDIGEEEKQTLEQRMKSDPERYRAILERAREQTIRFRDRDRDQGFEI